MAYKIRIILDIKVDVLRDLIIDEKSNLETLHFSIAKAFGFGGKEMASFYKTDDEWNQGDEIPLFDMSEEEEGFSMNTFKIYKVLTSKGTKLIYVYDFLKMWTFFVEVIDDNVNSDSTEPFVIFKVGEVPEKAPEKNFLADDPGFNNDEDSDSDYDYDDNIENIDDIDPDNLY